MLLKELCELHGVSGDEGAVRERIRQEIEPYADEIMVDTMGNLIALKRGSISDKKMMISAHMDEVGMIVTDITSNGFLKFQTVGGIDTRVLISKRVLVGEKKVPGIIGMKAIHLQKKSERETVPEKKSLYIDVGATSSQEAEKQVSLGDYVAFDTKFAEFGDGKIKAKALDDRVGCSVLADLIKCPVRYDTYFCFLVQEEVGLRGAQIAAHRIRPDVALVLETTTCSDVAGFEAHQYVTELEGGAVITVRDSSCIADVGIREFLEKTAKQNGILYQFKKTTAGGNDSGAIHTASGGVRTASLSVPCRYLHAPVGIIAKRDMQAVFELARLWMETFEIEGAKSV